MYGCSTVGGEYLFLLTLTYTLLLSKFSLAFNTDDIFKYFDTLKVIPPFEDLEKMSKTLYRCYSTTRGLHHALHDADLSKESSNWTRNVPVGSPWTGLAEDQEVGITFSRGTLHSASRKQKEPKKKKKQTKAEKEAEHERDEIRRDGDHVLSNSIAFMRDTLLSRECASAVAVGDVGRVWEVLKVRDNY